MKVCLVNAPTAAEFDTPPGAWSRGRLAIAEHPSLGILSLAAVLGRASVAHQILDLNGLFCDSFDGPRPPAPREFFARAKEAVLRTDAGAIGFSTLSSTYPFTVRLAAEVKHARPECTVIFGGPQASAVDVETLRAFPFVDIVVRGEAEEILPELLEAGTRPDCLDAIPGLAYRSNGKAVRTPDPESPPDLDRLPAPAYHLWPRLARQSAAPVEVGRGCPFSCTFCSTSRFFRRRFRLKSPARILEEMRAIRSAYGIGTFSLLHDSFTADRARTVEFCQALLASGEKFRWGCSARTDCLDDALLDLMAEAGCEGIFLGVETGSAVLQREIHKRLDLDHARAVIRHADGQGVRTVVSMIVGFPSESREDLRSTVDFLLDSVRHAHAEQQLHLLAPLAGSALYEQYRDCLEWDGMFSDMALQGLHQDADDRQLVRSHPQVFPNFYSVPAACFSRACLAELREFLLAGLSCFRWLMLALHDSGGGILPVFERWQAWLSARGVAVRDPDYFAAGSFRRDFLDFVRATYAETGPGAAGIATLLDYEEAAGQARQERSRARKENGSLDAKPVKAPGVVVIRLDADYRAIIERLKQKRRLDDIPRTPVILADRQNSESSAEVFELTPAAASLLELCDGTRTVREIAALFPGLDNALAGFPPEAACLFTLNELARQGLLVFTGVPGPTPLPPRSAAGASAGAPSRQPPRDPRTRRRASARSHRAARSSDRRSPR